MERLYLSPPDVGETERQLLLDAFDSNWIAPLGPHVDAFEREFAEFLATPDSRSGTQPASRSGTQPASRSGTQPASRSGTQPALGAAALSSGTAALHLALLMLGVRPGDDVVVPALTFVATANAVLYAGARPVFVDCDEATWNMDPALVDDLLAERARAGSLPAALIGVDLYGQCADWEPILASCARYGVPVVDDAAEALGATYRGRAAGTFGTLGVFSFNGNKIITTSGGGMLVSDDEALVERARRLSTQSRDDAPHYEHSVVGFNYRMSNLLAAVGRGQLQGLPAKVTRRRAIHARYGDALAGVAGIGFMPDAEYGKPTNWLTVITVDEGAFGASPAAIREHLEHANIEARPAWKPMHRQPLFSACEVRGGRVADGIFRAGLCLPSGSAMTDADVDRVIDAVLECQVT